MERSIRDMAGMPVRASDGAAGRVAGFYIDTGADADGWAVRYLVVEPAGTPQGGQVLVSPAALARPPAEGGALVCDMSAAEIAASPAVDTSLPLEPQLDALAAARYGKEGAVCPVPGETVSERLGYGIASVIDESFACCMVLAGDIVGTAVESGGEPVGTVDDLLLDDETWEVTSVTVVSASGDIAVHPSSRVECSSAGQGLRCTLMNAGR